MPVTESATGRTALLVLGMHRSGTSLLSGLIAQAGIELGAHLMDAAPDNPRGFFENQRVVDLNEQVLNQLGLGWSAWQPLPVEWTQLPEMERWRSDIQALISSEFESDLFCIKDPRMCRLLPLWVSVFEDLGIQTKVIVSSRPVAEVTASLQARDGMGKAQADALWLRHAIDIFQVPDLSGFHVTYDEVLADPAGMLLRLSELVGRELTLNDTGFVDGSLRHHQLQDDPAAWSVDMIGFLQRYPEPVDPAYVSRIWPLIEALAIAENRYQEVLAEGLSLNSDEKISARESLVFSQAQEAKTHALSLSRELETSRVYVADMQQKLEASQSYVQSLESEIEARDGQLQDSQRYVESLLTEGKTLREALQESQTYASSLREALDQREAEIRDRESKITVLQAEFEKAKQALDHELQRFPQLRRLRNLMKGNDTPHE